MSKKLQIRNSTAEFLVFSKQAGENTIEVRIENETVWLSQKLLAVLFEVEVNTINYHIKEIYKTQEQNETATIRKFRIVRSDYFCWLSCKYRQGNAIQAMGYQCVTRFCHPRLCA